MHVGTRPARPDLVAERMEHLRADIADGTWHARHGDLLRMDAIDGGLRLVVRHDPLTGSEVRRASRRACGCGSCVCSNVGTATKGAGEWASRTST